MSTHPFAAHQAALNAAIERHLPDVQVSFSGGPVFGGLLSRETFDPFGGATVDAARLRLGFLASRAPGLREGQQLLIDGVLHTVAGSVQPDASGWLSVTVHPTAAPVAPLSAYAYA